MRYALAGFALGFALTLRRYPRMIAHALWHPGCAH